MKINLSMLVGITLVASAVLVSFANADSSAKSAKYALASSDGIAYRMNTETGEISVCIRGMTMEENPGCTPWTK